MVTLKGINIVSPEKETQYWFYFISYSIKYTNS